MKIKPIKVKVLKSESSSLVDNREYKFLDFEKRARNIARAHGSYGYIKTWVKVYFDNNDTAEIRVDLAENDNHGIETYFLHLKAYYQTKNNYKNCQDWKFCNTINFE